MRTSAWGCAQKGVGALGVEFLPGVPLQGIRQPAQVPRKAGAGGRGALVGDGQQLQKFHLTTGSQHIVNAQHGIAAVGQHQSPDAGLLHLFQHSLGVTAQVGVGAALRAGKTFRQRIQRREGGPIPGKQLQRGVFAGIINRFAHTNASCLLCSISRKASSRVAVWPSIVLRGRSHRRPAAAPGSLGFQCVLEQLCGPHRLLAAPLAEVDHPVDLLHAAQLQRALDAVLGTAVKDVVHQRAAMLSNGLSGSM